MSIPISRRTENEKNIYKTDIYNSNRDFLIHHVGKDHIDNHFIINEITEMEQHGFTSNFIIENGKPIGVLDFIYEPSGYVYLSLLMLDKSVQREKLGTASYKYFEKEMISRGATIIRIDVVNDHTPNVILFWESMGFKGQNEDQLTWGEKTSTVLVMKKSIKMPCTHFVDISI